MPADFQAEASRFQEGVDVTQPEHQKSAESAARNDSFYDFLEKYVADGIKRELDQEEAVWRSVPAFVTALGLIGAILAFIGKALLPLENQAFSYAAMALALSGATCLLVAGWNLRLAVRPRRHGYLPDEEGVVNSFQDRKRYYEEQGKPSDEAGRLTLRDFRPDLLKKAAEAAKSNHQANSSKQTARTRAAQWLFSAAAFTFFAGGVALFYQSEKEAVQPHDGQIRCPASSAPTTTPSAAGQVGRERSHEPAPDAVARTESTDLTALCESGDAPC